MLATKQFWLLPTSIVWTKENTTEVNIQHSSNISFCVEQKKEIYIGTEQHEDE